jgi:hypothetical protein
MQIGVGGFGAACTFELLQLYRPCHNQRSDKYAGRELTFCFFVG